MIEVAEHNKLGFIMKMCERRADEVCPTCHKRLHHREPLSINDFVLCQNCSEMFEIVSQSPLKLEKVFEDRPADPPLFRGYDDPWRQWRHW